MARAFDVITRRGEVHRAPGVRAHRRQRDDLRISDADHDHTHALEDDEAGAVDRTQRGIRGMREIEAQLVAAALDAIAGDGRCAIVTESCVGRRAVRVSRLVEDDPATGERREQGGGGTAEEEAAVEDGEVNATGHIRKRRLGPRSRIAANC
jgi:hypothetical protein